MSRILRLALGLLLLLVGLRAVAYLAYAAYRLPCPRPETWHCEEKMVHLAWRVQEGRAFYPEWRDYPHVSNFFGPVYFLAVGLMGRAARADIPGLFRIGRVLSFAAGLLTSLIVGVSLRRRFGVAAGVIGGVASLGAAPMFGFSVMVRPDLMAETLGVAGFLLAVGGSARSRVVGGVLLVLAVLTKQTAAVFLLAASATWLFRGRWRTAAGLLAGAMAALAIVIGSVTAGPEPEFAASLLGEAMNPKDLPNWSQVVANLGRTAPDLLAFAAIGPWLWLRSRPREVAPATLAAALVASALAATMKQGADVHYFLSLRVVEGLAVGTLWKAALDRLDRPPPWLVASALLGAAALVPGVLEAGHRALIARDLAASLATWRGREITRTQAEVIRLARNPAVRMLTDLGLFDLYKGDRAEFVDPYLFRMLVESGRIRPARMRDALERESYDLLVISDFLDDPRYDSYLFGLPRGLVAAARRHYVFWGGSGGLFFYTPRHGPRRAGPAGLTGLRGGTAGAR